MNASPNVSNVFGVQGCVIHAKTNGVAELRPPISQKHWHPWRDSLPAIVRQLPDEGGSSRETVLDAALVRCSGNAEPTNFKVTGDYGQPNT
ncbi:MAG: hypothetical protein PHW60_04505 [Kiritimatiellae bacterium]|nr:hypothetical protein [Kiritimatiellia bacterium]